MISRRTTLSIANIYLILFTYSKRTQRTQYRQARTSSLLETEKLYDFIYANEYEPAFLYYIKNLKHIDIDKFKMFILELHTGDSIVSATKNWTWDQRRLWGQNLLLKLSKDIIVEANIMDKQNQLDDKQKNILNLLIIQLELDGYIFRDNVLYYSEATVIDTEEESGIVIKKIQEVQLENQVLIKHHLELSEEHYINNHWGDSIANSRNFLELVLLEVVSKHSSIIGTENYNRDKFAKHPVEVRNYLENNNLLVTKEKNALNSIYSLLSETGSHPYMPEKEQSRLLRTMALIFAEFILDRFIGFISSHTKT